MIGQFGFYMCDDEVLVKKDYAEYNYFEDYDFVYLNDEQFNLYYIDNNNNYVGVCNITSLYSNFDYNDYFGIAEVLFNGIRMFEDKYGNMYRDTLIDIAENLLSINGSVDRLNSKMYFNVCIHESTYVELFEMIIFNRMTDDDIIKFVYRMDSRGFYKSNNHLINWFKDSISY